MGSAPAIDRAPLALSQALLCAAHAAKLAYDDPEIPLEDRVRDCSFVLLARWTVANQVAIALEAQGQCFLSFRGTESLTDWLYNLDGRLRRGPWGCEVRQGYLRALLPLWPDINAFLCERRSVWLTGHSLGGALAMLAAAQLEPSRGENVAGICTFGQPPVGSLRFVTRFRQAYGPRYFRVINGGDPVPRARAPDRHACRGWYFTTGGRLQRRPSTRRVLGAQHGRAASFPTDLLRIHRMAAYLVNMEAQSWRFGTLAPGRTA